MGVKNILSRSVRGCDRKGCKNTMCDTHVKDIGYICEECKSGFKDYVAKIGWQTMSKGQIRKDLLRFMYKEKSDEKEMTIDEFFEGETED